MLEEISFNNKTSVKVDLIKNDWDEVHIQIDFCVYALHKIHFELKSSNTDITKHYLLRTNNKDKYEILSKMIYMIGRCSRVTNEIKKCILNIADINDLYEIIDFNNTNHMFYFTIEWIIEYNKFDILKKIVKIFEDNIDMDKITFIILKVHENNINNKELNKCIIECVDKNYKLYELLENIYINLYKNLIIDVIEWARNNNDNLIFAVYIQYRKNNNISDINMIDREILNEFWTYKDTLNINDIVRKSLTELYNTS